MRYAPSPTKLTDTTVRLRMMMLAGDCPVATITVAVAASMPPSRKNCQGCRNGSEFCAVCAFCGSVKIAEFVVKASGHLGIFDAGRHAGELRPPRPARRQVGHGQETGKANHDRHRPHDAAGAAVGRLAEDLVAAELGD